jgi:hypothetical protein
MLPRCAVALLLMAFVVGVAHSDTFLANITKVDGNKITYQKATYEPGANGDPLAKYIYAEPVTVEITKDAALTMGHFLPTDPRIPKNATPLEGGLDHPFFKKLAERKMIRPSVIVIADKEENKGKIIGINLWKSGSPK